MTIRWVMTIGLSLSLGSGCSRAYYRHDTDTDTHAILQEKACATPWRLPHGFSLQPDAGSRLADPTDPDDPALPATTPRLHTYELPPSARTPRAPTATHRLLPANEDAATLPTVPLPPAAWQSVPVECLRRMCEFESVREEYRRTHDAERPDDLRDNSPRLALEEIVDLALLNSREYQTEKEQIYLAALDLTLERFDYALKFSPTGNGTAVNYDHTRTGGTTVNTLSVPSSLQADKMLATGGSLLARFANEVVLTFNGPQGFAADISSELLFNLNQTMFQRDIRFEPLVQSERNVIYAARDFARFRKSFFFQRTSEYYALVRNYRQIEIEAQNYFSLVRALNQAEAEERAGLKSRIQVEQIEQSMLQGRSGLVTTCNNLERGLDRLKIAMGLPTEMPINLDLTELEQLTLRDESEVAGERLRRARGRLQSRREQQPPDRAEILNAATVLAERALDWLRLRDRLGLETPALDRLELLHARLRVDESRLDADRSRQELEKARRATPAAPAVLLFQRSIDLSDSLVELVNRQAELAARLHAEPGSIADLEQKNRTLKDRAGPLRQKFEAALKDPQLEQIELLLRDADRMLGEADALVKSADRMTGAPAELPTPEQAMQQALEQANSLLTESQRLLDEADVGLVPVAIDVEDAMLTALAQRLDLMNQRGALADDWRAIKLAADDLKSVLNLNATQIIGTKRNRPFGFTFDESRTELRASLDLPLNRKAQRNNYRQALINYQAALRALMEREDSIKLAVRDEVRDLSLARVQYLISVASAALAAERVLSTRLELALGFPGVAARDFLEAQDAYRESLGRVADNDVNYLVSRARFFLDLELMELDDTGFWPELFDRQFQPTPRTEFPSDAGPAYGTLPEFLHLSREIQRMLQTW